jgi:hypothetical protein
MLIIKWAANFFFKTKLGIVVLIAGALTLYHFSEVRGAIKDALSNAADEAVIAAQNQTIALLNAKIEVNEKLLEQFEKSAAQADEIAANAKLELEEYESNNAVNANCNVDPAILNRLSNK